MTTTLLISVARAARAHHSDLPCLQYPAHASLSHVLSVQLPLVRMPCSRHSPFSKQNALDAQHAEGDPLEAHGV